MLAGSSDDGAGACESLRLGKSRASGRRVIWTVAGRVAVFDVEPGVASRDVAAFADMFVEVGAAG